VWAQTGAAEVCELGRSVGQSLVPSPGREGAALHGDSPSLSGQRHYAAVSVDCGAVITRTKLRSLSSS